MEGGLFLQRKIFDADRWLGNSICTNKQGDGQSSRKLKGIKNHQDLQDSCSSGIPASIFSHFWSSCCFYSWSCSSRFQVLTRKFNSRWLPIGCLGIQTGGDVLCRIRGIGSWFVRGEGGGTLRWQQKESQVKVVGLLKE